MAPSFHKYLHCLQQSELMEPAGIDYHLEQYQNLSSDAADDAAAFGQRLVAAGLLTAWQNEKLQQGKWKGMRIDGYTLTEPLGEEGEDGDGYLVLPDDPSGQPAVLRALPWTESTPDLVRLEQVYSPYVVRVLRHVSDEKVRIFFEERVVGRSLEATVEEWGPLGLPAAVRVMLHAARGLAALHAVGLCYRLFTADDLLLVAGGAKVRRLEKAVTWTDRRQYLAPCGGAWIEEQLNLPIASYGGPDQVRDRRSDIYSLACVLHLALAGEPPFVGSAAQRQVQHDGVRPPSLHTVRPEAPAMLAHLYQQMMAKNPADRPQDMAEVCDVLLQTGVQLGVTLDEVG